MSAAEPIGPAEKEPDEPADGIQGDTPVSIHPAVVTHLLKPSRQDVLEKATDKLVSIDGSLLHLLGLRRGVAEGNRMVIDVDDATITDGDPIDIGCQVFEYGLSVTDGLDIDLPAPLPDLVRNVFEELGAAECVAQLGSIDDGRAGFGEEEVGGSREPLGSVFAYAATRYDEVHMRVIDHRVSSPGMQHAEEADPRGSQPTSGEQLANRLAAGREQGVVARLLMSAQRGPQFLRNGEGDQKMVNRQ